MYISIYEHKVIGGVLHGFFPHSPCVRYCHIYIMVSSPTHPVLDWTPPSPKKSSMYIPENYNTGRPLSNVSLHARESSRATGIHSKSCHHFLHLAWTSSSGTVLNRSTQRIHALHWEQYQARFRQKERKTPTNPTGRRTDDVQSPSVRGRRRHWAAALREAKQRWSEDMIQEQARLLAAYHHVGSMRVPRWVKEEIYTYMEWCARQKNIPMIALTFSMTRMYQHSGFWAPEKGITWECDSSTEGRHTTSDAAATLRSLAAPFVAWGDEGQ